MEYSIADTRAAFASGLSNFLSSPDFADFAIVCGPSEWKVHRIVLSLHSSVFAKSCNSAFKEAKEGKLDLSVHAREHVDSLVQYLYTFDYAPSSECSSGCFHLHMFLMADLYDIPGLSSNAVDKLQYALWDRDNAKDLADMARLAYNEDNTSITGEICEQIADTVVRNCFLHNPFKEQWLYDAMHECPNFASDVLERLYKLVNRED